MTPRRRTLIAAPWMVCALLWAAPLAAQPWTLEEAALTELARIHVGQRPSWVLCVKP